MKSSFLYKQFKTAIEQLNPTQHPLCVALSGGVDSVVLLHLCATLRSSNPNIGLSAVYINHGLSEHADDWQQFCQDLCAQLEVSFQSQPVIIEHKPRHSIEAQARELRYQALDKVADTDALLVLGQHADDQLETFLLRLKRGSGLLGLGGMKATTQLANGRRCIRPLLACSREEIELFAQHYELPHIEDESNQQDNYDRNYLRNQVIPLLKSRFKGFLPSSTRSIQLLQQQQQLIDEITDEDLQHCLYRNNDDDCIDLSKLTERSVIRQKNVVRAWLAQQQVTMPSLAQLEQILTQSFNSKVDAQLKIDLQSGSVRRHRGLLYWVEMQTAPIEQNDIGVRDVVLNTTKVLGVNHGAGIRMPLSDEVVSVKYGRAKEKIRPYAKPGRNTLKHWLKDAGVPVWQREHIPLIYYNDVLVQVVGYYFNHDFKVSCGGIFWEECNDK
ncbi:tRNA(Ile)-lysidine synthase [Pseudoalteromonas citrea]|uniref:tRNA(Ile)-lysidine synthase n=2 Tax=Pseudoalteromonas citrea TaxID=43655 RepID=A0AAD4FTS0_9GAMM|nr:tRNA lysidine(34) synthetase TilS [Pseudoalteromonas citrea]KAF7775287.1 tRNA(Ile)-lysidine synthase [Pseudoalteromonas citrea]